MPTNRPRFVFDTNVVISAALLSRSVSRRALDKALDEGELLVSVSTIDELDRVLRRFGIKRDIEHVALFRRLMNSTGFCGAPTSPGT